MQNISDFLSNSVSFGLCISLVCFWIADLIYKKTKFVLFAPLLVSCTFVIIFLVIFKIPYAKYLEGAKFLYYLMTPCTVALAIPLYRQFTKLKENAPAIILGIVAGILANGFFVFAMCAIFKIGHTEYVSLLPKSITTPIGIALSNQNGGIESVTILLISIAGNFEMGDLQGAMSGLSIAVCGVLTVVFLPFFVNLI